MVCSIILRPGYTIVINVFCFICRHPDKNKNENAGDKFVEINKAYEVKFVAIVKT